jgi:hypothetical protein
VSHGALGQRRLLQYVLGMLNAELLKRRVGDASASKDHGVDVLSQSKNVLGVVNDVHPASILPGEVIAGPLTSKLTERNARRSSVVGGGIGLRCDRFRALKEPRHEREQLWKGILGRYSSLPTERFRNLEVTAVL